MLLAWLLSGSVVFGHGGAVDAQGCHLDKAAGERHCHESKKVEAPKRLETFEAKVIRVKDGDSVVVLREDRPVELRLWGIDAPERQQPFSQVARKRLDDLVMGKTVKVTVRDFDKRWKRPVVELELADGTHVNRELVREGLAEWYWEYARTDSELERLESEAKAGRRGLWVQPAPVRPSLFRRSKEKKPVPVL